ncbi:META domain-containing protein [Paracoccus sp. (in: a-proteobacteria)]|uniref:META domain-containing protein n=1 Tax=Paracoccus sp. TaxID=267 RepID=UPI0026E07697|nr:META domain-containing protein [Paracoccus sp. (in: a-proteobacteria)]MDO5647609.1 META domain-containing protein [Paracoccus sp. (in: a-proteobacteria)]
MFTALLSRPALTATCAALTLAACASTPAGDPMGGVPATSYVLVGIANDTVPLRNITLTATPEGVQGRGPCNGYAARNTAQWPAVALEPIRTTGVTGCKDLAIEQRFLNALQQANVAEYYGGVLRFKGPTWLIMETGVPADQAQDALTVARGN